MDHLENYQKNEARVDLKPKLDEQTVLCKVTNRSSQSAGFTVGDGAPWENTADTTDFTKDVVSFARIAMSKK